MESDAHNMNTITNPRSKLSVDPPNYILVPFGGQHNHHIDQIMSSIESLFRANGFNLSNIPHVTSLWVNHCTEVRLLSLSLIKSKKKKTL